MRDPYTLAHTLGLPIIHTPLPAGIQGLYQGTHIALRPGLTQRAERSVLAHELGHHHYGHTHIPRTLAPKIENACDLYAAEMLIDEQELINLAHQYPEDPAHIAYELGVTDWILNAYIRAHPLPKDT